MKVLENLEVSLAGGGVPVTAIAICYQNAHTRALAQKLDALLPQKHFLVDATQTAPTDAKLQTASHAIEFYNPYGEHYDKCRLVRAAMFARGCRIVDLYDWQENYFEDAFWGPFDYRTCTADLEKVKQELLKVKEFHITSPQGTDIKFSTYGKDWIVANGLTRSDELSQMPDGEIYTCPIEETFTGTLVVDGTVTRSWVPEPPEKVMFREGRIVGGTPKILDYIGKLGPDAQMIGEFALGFNPAYNKELHHNMSVDEKGLGTVHFAVGDSYNLGKNHCVAHCDMLIRHPVIHTDPAIKLPAGFTVK